MIAPARTWVPSKTFTPRRWAAESRPLRVEPPPLVLDISSVLAPADAGDLDGRVLLAVAPGLPAACLVLVGEALDLGALGLADDAARDGRAREFAGAGQHDVAVDEQHGLERDLITFTGMEKLDRDLLALFDALLFATGLDHRIHKRKMLPDGVVARHQPHGQRSDSSMMI